MTTAEIQETVRKKNSVLTKKLDISEVLLHNSSHTTSDKIKKGQKHHKNIVNVVHTTPVLYLKSFDVFIIAW